MNLERKMCNTLEEFHQRYPGELPHKQKWKLKDGTLKIGYSSQGIAKKTPLYVGLMKKIKNLDDNQLKALNAFIMQNSDLFKTE